MLRNALIIFLLVSSAPVLALDDNTFQRLEQKKSGYNQNVDKVPGIVKTLLGNQRVNVALTGCQSDCVLGVVTNNARIVELKKGEIDKPTMTASMSESILIRLLDSSDPRGDFISALKNGQIKISGVGIFNKIKLSIVSLLAKLLL